jgi:1-acyl-sn-glycerol-3-phosphate acyltransferase
MQRARRDPIYSAAIGIGRVFFGGILRLRRSTTGLDRIPDAGGAVLAITHFGYMDFALTEWVIWGRNRRHIRFLAMKGAFDKPVVGWFLRGMRHISVDMTAGQDAYLKAVTALRSGELLGVFPEAGVSASFTVRELKTGAVRMAAEAGVPVIPVAIWGGHLLKTKNRTATWREAYRAPIAVSVGEPIATAATDDPAEITERLRTTLQLQLDALQRDYPRDGTGQWWQPAHLGGTAPTPEVAAVAEAARQKLKAEKRLAAELIAAQKAAARDGR